MRVNRFYTQFPVRPRVSPLLTKSCCFRGQGAGSLFWSETMWRKYDAACNAFFVLVGAPRTTRGRKCCRADSPLCQIIGAYDVPRPFAFRPGKHPGHYAGRQRAKINHVFLMVCCSKKHGPPAFGDEHESNKELPKKRPWQVSRAASIFGPDPVHFTL